MKLTDPTGTAVYMCDFCGVTSQASVWMFVSSLNRATAICKPCGDALPFVLGKPSVMVTVKQSFGVASPDPKG